MSNVYVRCRDCYHIEKYPINDRCTCCGGLGDKLIQPSGTFPQAEDIYELLRNGIRGDYFTREQLTAIKEMAEYGLGESNHPHCWKQETPFETAIPQEIRSKLRTEV